MGSSIVNVGTNDSPNLSSKCKIKIEIGPSSNTHLDSIYECKPSNLGEALPLNLQERKKYGCKFCESAFSCRFGLSGHQNVHKREWAMERAKKAQKDFSREMKRYKSKVAISSPYPISVTGFSIRPSTNKPCQVQNYSTNMRNFMVGPTMPVGRMTYLTNNIPRYSRIFRGWNTLVPTTSRFTGAPLVTRHHVSTSQVIVRDKIKKYARTPVHNQRAIAPRNFQAQINNLADEEVIADSGLDLELRL